MLSGKQRAYLRGLANPMETILQVGKSGVGGSTAAQVDQALEARELIKLRVLETCPQTAREAARLLADSTGAEIVQVVGTRFVLFRQSAKDPKITLGQKS
ncbi:MAG: YhbY family RNA-binding protein [Oscillospiraceae bacterium]|nr:YhbY family RNA-binding protein [Oscillospiraceae bacterium]